MMEKYLWIPFCLLGLIFMGASIPSGCSADEMRTPFREIGRVSFTDACKVEGGYPFRNESRDNSMVITALNTSDSTSSTYFEGFVQKGESILLKCPGSDSGYFKIKTRS